MTRASGHVMIGCAINGYSLRYILIAPLSSSVLKRRYTKLQNE